MTIGKSSWANVAVNALQWRNLRVMAGKAWLRVSAHVSENEKTRSRQWCSAHCECVESFANELDHELWREALAFGTSLDPKGRRVADQVGIKLGGAAHYRLLYFLTRYLRPLAVVETGVAAGFSSAAILEALDRNGRGELFSSDFPYFRLKDPEQYIGIVVDDRLKSRWHLFLEGDRRNLQKILQAVGGGVGLVHYDSDKSPASKRWFADVIFSRLIPKSGPAFLIFDDIGDDGFFASYVHGAGLSYRVFGFEGKYLGMIEIWPRGDADRAATRCCHDGKCLVTRASDGALE
jgi:hypothetical protein